MDTSTLSDAAGSSVSPSKQPAMALMLAKHRSANTALEAEVGRIEALVIRVCGSTPGLPDEATDKVTSPSLSDAYDSLIQHQLRATTYLRILLNGLTEIV